MGESTSHRAEMGREQLGLREKWGESNSGRAKSRATFTQPYGDSSEIKFTEEFF